MCGRNGQPLGKSDILMMRQSEYADNHSFTYESVDWMNLAYDRDQWQELVNTVMKLRVS